MRLLVERRHHEGDKCSKNANAVGELNANHPSGVGVDPRFEFVEPRLKFVDPIVESCFELVESLLEPVKPGFNSINIARAGNVVPSAWWQVFHQCVSHCFSDVSS